MAWFTTEANEVGLHEFADWAKEARTEMMYAVNLGTRGPDDARNAVEYANHPSGSFFSDLRINNGAKEPFNIKLWCLGNEMDGPWQMGKKTAYEYGRAANEAAKMMKWVDDSIELVACGSSSREMPTYGSWEYEVLSECYENVDYLSLHRYYGNHEGDTPYFLARSMEMDAFIKEVAAICDAVGAKKRQRKKIHLSFDEWNVWYHSNQRDRELHQSDRWGRALPLLEDVYNFEDALVVGAMLITLMRNADRVKVACMAQLVNVIAPIMTRTGGGVWAQTIFYPLMQASALGRGVSLHPVMESPVYACRDFDEVPVVDAAAVLSKDGNLTIFCINRDLREDVRLHADLRAFGGLEVTEHSVLHHADVNAVNTEAAPDTVVPAAGDPGAVDGGRLTVTLPALSWNVICLKKREHNA